MNNIIFDAHCDTLDKIADFGGGLRENNYNTDLNRMKESGGYIQVFAAFVDKEKIKCSPKERVSRLIDIYYRELGNNNDIALHCTNGAEIENTLSQNKIAALLSIEGGEAIEGSLDNLHMFYQRGVRIMTLNWNYPNEICDGNGLTAFGKAVICEMNKLGMLIDVSHLSQKGFWNVIELSKKPVLATHSNAKSLCSHSRNLDDEQIKAIIKNGGCIGINFYPCFVKGEKCTAGDIVDHIEYMQALGGENNIGFGSDFDGTDSLPDGICGVQHTVKIIDEMQKRRFSGELIEKITHKNFIRVLKKA